MKSEKKIHDRINWNTTLGHGTVDTNKYLGTQLARAICLAAYEKPLTVEEISIKTGLPAMYIEDELPRLIQGEAVIRKGKKYLTNFIILQREDNKKMIASKIKSTNRSNRKIKRIERGKFDFTTVAPYNFNDAA